MSDPGCYTQLRSLDASGFLRKHVSRIHDSIIRIHLESLLQMSKVETLEEFLTHFLNVCMSTHTHIYMIILYIFYIFIFEYRYSHLNNFRYKLHIIIKLQ